MGRREQILQELERRVGRYLWQLLPDDEACEAECFVAVWSDDGGRTVCFMPLTYTLICERMPYLNAAWVLQRLEQVRDAVTPVPMPAPAWRRTADGSIDVGA